MTELLERAEKALARDLCDHCLGRLFAHVDTGLSDQERGESLRMGVQLQRALDGKEPIPAHQKCFVCEDLFTLVTRFADSVIEKLNGLEFDTFLVGTRVDPLVSEREEQVWADVGQSTAETIKAELNQEIGKEVQRRIPQEVEFSTPDVVALVDTRFSHVDLDITPLFVYGRYRKLSREIPQTRWPCNRCRGKGCQKCGGTGKMYQTSVQEIIGGPIMREAKGKDHFFHGMGREDIDARMLGAGRPFVMEIVAPRRRGADLPSLEQAVNSAAEGRVAISIDGWATRAEVEILKSEKAHKKYRISVEVEGGIARNELEEALDRLRGALIAQQTPARVVHRRADRIRERRVVDARVAGQEDGIFFLDVVGEAGLYVKELVSGDNGRTRPSLAGLLGRPARVIQLDVLEVEGREEME